MNERPIPEAACQDPSAVEMLRVWIAQKGLHCSIKVGMYRETTAIAEEKAWGIILADVARHLAAALSSDQPHDQATELELIQEAFLAELSAPTSNVSGDFIKK